jgi:membrane-bound lytic murein transglycosylase B
MKQLLTTTLISALLIGQTACATTPQNQTEIKTFAAEMAQKHDFSAVEVEALLKNTVFRDDIIAAITRPAESKPWHQYRPIFLKPDRITGGVKFWQENEALLESVSQSYGVPPEIIVAIIGVETRYGKFTGRYRILDSLTTLAFGYPKRASFFRKELEQFLLLSREESIDLQAAKGSYAGAMGKPQFISSSYRRYAVDHDNDGKRDLFDNNADIIASVANYFKIHGWRSGEPITLQAKPGAQADLQSFVDAGMKPSIQVKSLLNSGLNPIDPSEKPNPSALSSLIELEVEDGNEYWLGLHNFYVITRYNHSNLYAMAAYQLSREIVAAKQAAEKR